MWGIALLGCVALISGAVGVAIGEWNVEKRYRKQLYDERIKTSLAQAKLIEWEWQEKHTQPAYEDFEMVLPEASLPFNVLLPHSINWN